MVGLQSSGGMGGGVCPGANSIVKVVFLFVFFLIVNDCQRVIMKTAGFPEFRLRFLVLYSSWVLVFSEAKFEE